LQKSIWDAKIAKKTSIWASQATIKGKA